MKFFLHTPDYVRIVNDASSPSEFTCTPEQWALLEPEYPALPSGMTLRCWTPEQHYVSDGVVNYPEEGFSAEAYCNNVAAYQTPCICADVQISATELCINADPVDTITFQAWLRDCQNNILPVTDGWIIRLRDAHDDEIDAFPVQFTAGATPQMTYSAPPNAHLGRVHIDEADFTTVTVPGIGTYAVTLLTPVEFTLYREL